MRYNSARSTFIYCLYLCALKSALGPPRTFLSNITEQKPDISSRPKDDLPDDVLDIRDVGFKLPHDDNELLP